MRGTMRQKLLVFMAGLVILVVMCGWVINSLFLERFYLYSKADTLRRSWLVINGLYNAESDELGLEMEKLQLNQGMQVVVFSQKLDAVYFAWQDLVRLGPGQILIPNVPSLRNFVAEPGNHSRYEITKNYDNRLKSEYLDLVGTLDNGLYVLLRIPIQSITESVGIANRFLLFTGILSILMAFFISARLSSQIANPIRAVDGIAKSMSHLDFSQRIRVENEDEIGSLAASINMLSDHLQETIRELQTKNQQLEEDIQYISKLDAIRQEFLSSISHELKTPIALIQGYAEALEEKVVTSEADQAYYYHVISDEADKMNKLVKQLTNLNNLESGHDDLYLESFDLAFLTRSIIRRGKTLPGAEALNFQYEGPEEAWAFGDMFLIEEVVFNYLTNAIHYAAGRRLVRVRVRDVAEEEQKPAVAESDEALSPLDQGKGAAPGLGASCGRQIRLEVFNSGSSLTEEERERVWDRFYKADKSRSREYGGSGLGLSVVRIAMERHQSAYGVENLEDGVNFWFVLPAGKAPDDFHDEPGVS